VLSETKYTEINFYPWHALERDGGCNIKPRAQPSAWSRQTRGCQSLVFAFLMITLAQNRYFQNAKQCVLQDLSNHPIALGYLSKHYLDYVCRSKIPPPIQLTNCQIDIDLPHIIDVVTILPLSRSIASQRLYRRTAMVYHSVFSFWAPKFGIHGQWRQGRLWS